MSPFRVNLPAALKAAYPKTPDHRPMPRTQRANDWLRMLASHEHAREVYESEYMSDEEEMLPAEETWLTFGQILLSHAEDNIALSEEYAARDTLSLMAHHSEDLTDDSARFAEEMQWSQQADDWGGRSI